MLLGGLPAETAPICTERVALREYCPVMGGEQRSVNWIYRFWRSGP